MADMEALEPRKAHNAPHSGRKAEKKKNKTKNYDDNPDEARFRNPKAFAIQSVNKAERRFRRTMDIKSKGYHVPTVDRTPVIPPPVIVVIAGGPKVGKTTLLKCLARNFSGQKLTSINGPVTLISGKKKRITLIECNNDINMMIDLVKIADLALLIVDAKSGLEMEIFEFLNICQVHGMPRLMSVLTHLDMFKNKKSLQRQKVFLKKRIATEIPRCEKMFYFSGILHGEYLKNEVKNLGRFIAVIKYELSSWKKSHPYVFVDRMEDMTDPESLSKDQNCNRKVCFYGYARGGALKQNSYYHIPGCGDYLIKNIHFLPDPCPRPDKLKKRSLNEKERRIYAPMSGVGGIVFDKDAVYIEMKVKENQETGGPEKEADKFLRSMVSVQHPIDEKIKVAPLQLYPDSEFIADNEHSSDDEESDDEEEEGKGVNDEDEKDWSDDGFGTKESDNDFSDDESNINELKTRGNKRKVTFAEDDAKTSSDENISKKNNNSRKRKAESDSEEEIDFIEMGEAKWKENLVKRAADDFYERQKQSTSLQRLVYGGQKGVQKETDDSDSEDEIGGLFRLAKHEKEKKDRQSDNGLDCSIFKVAVQRDWTNDDELQMIRDCFVSGKWDENEDAEHLLNENEGELYGDFEDLETGIVHKGKETVKKVPEGENKDENTPEEEKENEETEEVKNKKEMTLREKRLEKKKKLKELFNQQFDDSKDRAYHDDLKMEADAQGELNKTEFEGLDDDVRVHFEGYRPGLYLRVEVEDMPCEFVKNFDPSYPVIIGSVLKGEEKMGYLQARIKCHRFYRRDQKKLVLKSGDPLILSIGWRRIQTVPIYYMVDHNMRCRYLKYTPEHLHCMASFWGPITQQKAGIVGFQSVREITLNFRIAAVGSITEVDHVTNIVKKLKLKGYPKEVFKNTAFIKDMFTSPLEVTKYQGAAIRTTSGLRGQIKKALRTPGEFRATFEDKILMSDIVFLRTWVNVPIPRFCIPVTSLLLPSDQKSKWQGCRTLGCLRRDKGLTVAISEDSKYTPIVRREKIFAPLIVPKHLQKALPFKDKIIHQHKKRKDPENDRVAVIKEPREREVSKMMNMLKVVHEMKVKKDTLAMRQRVKAHRKEKRKNEAIHHKKVQEMKKRIMSRRPKIVPEM